MQVCYAQSAGSYLNNGRHIMRNPPRKKWRFRNPDFDSSIALAAEVGISPLAAQLLINRGIKNADDAQAYLYPTFEQLHSPFNTPLSNPHVNILHFP